MLAGKALTFTSLIVGIGVVIMAASFLAPYLRSQANPVNNTAGPACFVIK